MKTFTAPHPRHRNASAAYLFIRETQYYVIGLLCFPSRPEDSQPKRIKKTSIKEDE